MLTTMTPGFSDGRRMQAGSANAKSCAKTSARATLWRLFNVLRQASLRRFFLERGEPGQRINRRHAIQIEVSNPGPELVRRRHGRRVEERKLALRIGRRAAHRRPAASRQL